METEIPKSGELILVSNYPNPESHEWYLREFIGMDGDKVVCRNINIPSTYFSASHWKRPISGAGANEIKKAVAYGIGFVCGRHNLSLTQETIEAAADSYLASISQRQKP